MKRVFAAFALVAAVAFFSAPVTRAADEKTIKGQVVDVSAIPTARRAPSTMRAR